MSTTRPLDVSSPEPALGRASSSSACSLKTRIGPSAVFGETRTEVLPFVTHGSHRACGDSWPENASDLFFFSQEDPVDTGWPSAYAYSLSDPPNFTDPTGLAATGLAPQPAPAPMPGPAPRPRPCLVPPPKPVPVPALPPWWLRWAWVFALWNNTADAPTVPDGGNVLPFPGPRPQPTPCEMCPTPTPTPKEKCPLDHVKIFPSGPKGRSGVQYCLYRCPSNPDNLYVHPMPIGSTCPAFLP